jgi:hypothetical protein
LKALVLTDGWACRPAEVIIGKSRIALIGNPTMPVVLNSGAVVRTMVHDLQHLLVISDFDLSAASWWSKAGCSSDICAKYINITGSLAIIH